MSIKEIASELTRLRIELSEAKQRIPAHGATPAQFIEVEDLEERIAELERKLSLERRATS
jgi:hypothetical protein